ncbi:MAG: insulinase family protein [Clostridiales bacterium]|nr:insulinase family protein [Clostridiales bacterium]
MPEQKQLKNGIRVVYEQVPATRSVSIGIWIGAGSLHEYAEINGITHFIEHMLFKGTATRSAKQIAVEMDSIGGSINAFTAKECTCYYAKVLDEHLGTAVDLLCDIVLHSELNPAELEREKGVICEEIYMTEDSPEDLVFEMGAALFFADTTLERPILGTEETVQRLRREDLIGYMRTHYTNDNIVVACAGSFDPAQLFELLETRLTVESEVALRNPQPYAIKPGFRTAFAQKDIEQIHTCISFPAFALETEEYYALCVLSNILGGSMSSRLFQKIREEKGLAYSVYTYPMAYCGVGALCVYAGSGEKQAKEVLRLMLAEFSDIVENGVTEEEFIRCKEQLKGSYLLGLESAGSKMNAIGKTLLLQNKLYSQEKTLSSIETVKIHDIFRIIPQVFGANTMTCAAVGRVGKLQKPMEKMLADWWETYGQTGADLSNAGRAERGTCAQA